MSETELNIVFRKCTRCEFEGEGRKEFSYIGLGEWVCRCGSKYTNVSKIIYSEEQKGET